VVEQDGVKVQVKRNTTRTHVLLTLVLFFKIDSKALMYVVGTSMDFVGELAQQLLFSTLACLSDASQRTKFGQNLCLRIQTPQVLLAWLLCMHVADCLPKRNVRLWRILQRRLQSMTGCAKSPVPQDPA
jgi:hypothetical protein